MHLPSKSRFGFSLVEIVIAIGITAFTLATIAGIFGIVSQSAQESTRDTLMTSMIGQVMSDLRSVPFDVLWNADPRGKAADYLTALKPAQIVPPTGTPADTVYYFTSEGVMILPDPPTTTPPSFTSHKTSPPKTLYRCKVTKAPDTTTQSFSGANNPPGYNRLQLTLSFDWPAPSGVAITSPNGPNVKQVNESAARYF